MYLNVYIVIIKIILIDLIKYFYFKTCLFILISFLNVPQSTTTDITYYMMLLLVFLNVLIIIGTGMGYSAEDVVNLKKTLFQTYDKDVRPSLDFSKSLAVDVKLVFHEIDEVNEKSQSISGSGKLKIKWNDNYLTWNESHFYDINQILVPDESIWKPDIRIHNGRASIGNYESKSKQLKVGKNGDVTWTHFLWFETQCAIDVKYYPFDSQSCDIEFIFLNGDGIWIDSAVVDTDVTEVKDDWIIEKTKSRIINRNNKQRAQFKLYIKRKPYRVLLEFVLPVVMMAVLDLFTFCIPCDSGEKISYTTTMYLAFSVYTFILSSYLPESSDNSVIAIFLKAIMVLETAIVAVTAIQLRINHHSNNPSPPSWVKVICRLTNKVTCYSNKNKVTVFKEKHSEDLDVDEKISGEDVKRTCDNLDRILFWFFAVAMFLTSLTCLLVVS